LPVYFTARSGKLNWGRAASGNSISPTFVKMGISGKRGVVLQLQLLVILMLVVIAAAAAYQRHYNSESTVHENLQAGTAGDRHLASHVRIYKPAAIYY
jgi:hypothetical protein